MTEHPLLFSAEMVRAILVGRKTVTRRMPKNPSYYDGWKQGDRVWVREAWAFSHLDLAPIYRATHDDDDADNVRWKPSIHMPRWASRITLELTADVRREPLHELDEMELNAEGFFELSDFVSGWDAMHPDSPWRSNPEVSVIEFKVIDRNSHEHTREDRAMPEVQGRREGACAVGAGVRRNALLS